MGLLLSSCSIVNPGQKGIRVSLGNASKVLEPGAYLWVPIVYGLAKIDTQIQKTDIKTGAASKDMQEIATELAVNWSINGEKSLTMYKEIGDEDAVYNRIIAPAVSEVMKSVVSKRTAEEVLTKRLELKKDIDEGLTNRLKNYGVTLHDVSIVNFSFSHEFTVAIEQKQIAEQKAKQSEYDAQRAVKEADAEVNRAKGQAEAQKLLRLTLSPELLQMKAIEKWDGNFPQVMGGNGTLPFINLKLNSKTTQE